MKIFTRKIVCILFFALWASFMPVTNAQDYSFTEAFVTLKCNNLHIGNIFFGDNPGWYLKLENPEAVSHNINLTYNVTDEFGNIVWSLDGGTFELKAGATQIKSVIPHVDKYGIYKITAQLTGDFETIEVYDSFSVAAQNYKRNDFMSVQTHFNRSDESADITLHQVKNSGFGWCREDYAWSGVETEATPGEYQIPEIENKINKMIDTGNNVLLTLQCRNILYDNNTLPSSDVGIKAYADFCAWTAEHFYGKIDAFEIGNEADLIDYAGRDVSGEEYAKLLKAAHDAIKSVDENITVVGGALCSYSNEENREFLQEFMTEISSNGTVFDYMDVFSFHPYNDTGLYSDEEPEYTFLQNVSYVQKILGTEIPIWISEYGTSSCDAGAEQEWGYTERQQAANLVRTAVASKSEAQVEKFSIYNFHEKGQGSSQQENYGIVDSDYNAKPAFIALSFMNHVLNNADYIGKLANIDYYSGIELWFKENRSFDAYRFKQNNDDIFVLWEHTGKTVTLKTVRDNVDAAAIASSGDTVTITMPSDGVAEFYDMYGNAVEGNDLELCNEPIYVILRKPIKVIDNGTGLEIIGIADEPLSNITLWVETRGGLKREIAGVEQTVSDENGNFNFKINIPEDEAYMLYIYQGEEVKNIDCRQTDYEIDVQCFVNSKIISSIEELENNDVVKVILDITDTANTDAKLLFIGSLNRKDGRIGTIQTSEIKWMDDNTATAELSFKIDDVADTESLKIFLWKDNIIPVSKPLSLGKDK